MRVFLVTLLDRLVLEAQKLPAPCRRRWTTGWLGDVACALLRVSHRSRRESTPARACQDRNPREDEPRDLGVLLPLLRRPQYQVDEIDAHPRTKQCPKENPEVSQGPSRPPRTAESLSDGQGPTSCDSQLLLASPPPGRSPDNAGRPLRSGLPTTRSTRPQRSHLILT